MNTPAEIKVDVVAPEGVVMHGPTREHVGDDPYQDDPRVLTAYNGFSPSGDVTADVVYANYGRPEDFKKLKELGVETKGKIAIVRYGVNFRGVKPFVASENGCVGVIIYSDPWDDGYYKGDKYPKGPWRPDTAVQRGSVQYLFRYPGDPTTPGIASLPDLPDSKRTPPEQATDLTKIPTTPLSYADATPILANLGGPESSDLNCIASRSAGQQAHTARAGDGPDEDSDHSVVVCRRHADPGEPGRTGVAARVAGGVAVYLSRGRGAGESSHAAEAELSVDHHLRRDRHGEGQRGSRAGRS